MIKFAERISSINEYYFSSKLREVKTLIDSGKEIINLGIGSPDLMPPISAIENLKSGLSVKNAHKYQSYNGIDRIRLETSRFYKSHYGVDLNYKTDILPLIGSKEGIFHISMAFLSKNDKVLIPNPGYPAYSSITKLIGNSVVYYNLSEKNNWLPEINELNQHNLSEVKLMWINYPHMPSGSLASISYLKKLVDFAASNNILLVNDNPYSFILNKKPISIMNVEGAMEYCIELNSLSKSFNMAGWRIGFAVGNKEYISNILKVKSNIDSGMFLPLQLGAVSALSESKEWFKSLNEEYQKRRELVWILADKLNCKFSKNTAGMFVWAKISSTNNSKKFVDKLLNEKDIFVAPGVIFGSNGEGYIRISLCNTIENIKKAIKKL